VRTKGIKLQDDTAMEAMLHRIVAMLIRMAMRFDGVAKQCAAYDEHESQAEETPEPWDATERRW
jgi:hypothetical protein